MPVAAHTTTLSVNAWPYFALSLEMTWFSKNDLPAKHRKLHSELEMYHVQLTWLARACISIFVYSN